VTVTGAFSEYGGAVWVSEGMLLELDRCIFTANSTIADGGAVISFEARPRITDCLFADNVGVRGGAIYAVLGELDLENCTFAGNSAADGGAVYIEAAYRVAVTGCTFAANAAARGSALALLATDHEPTTMTRTLIAFGADGEGFYWDGAGELNLTHSDIYGNAGGDWVGALAPQFGQGGNVGLDPLFCDLAGGDFTLREDSPCLPENNDSGVLIGAHGLGCGLPTATRDRAAATPAVTRLGNWPNPCNPRTTISFHVAVAARIRVDIYDLNGRRVAALADRFFGAGVQSVPWDGRDAAGRALGSGTYIVRLEAVNGRWTTKTTLLR
jgi:hypothetical protein